VASDVQGFENSYLAASPQPTVLNIWPPDSVLANPGTTTPSLSQSDEILRIMIEEPKSIELLESLVSPFAFSSVAVEWAVAEHNWGAPEGYEILNMILDDFGITQTTGSAGSAYLSELYSKITLTPMTTTGTASMAITSSPGQTGFSSFSSDTATPSTGTPSMTTTSSPSQTGVSSSSSQAGALPTGRPEVIVNAIVLAAGMAGLALL
jgi:hypothetical protein